MKTKEELNALKEEDETLSRKLRKLTVEEFEQIAGGVEYKTIQYGETLSDVAQRFGTIAL